jgi:hypothetical protein
MSRSWRRRDGDAERVYGTDWDALDRERVEARKAAKAAVVADVHNTDWDQFQSARNTPDDWPPPPRRKPEQPDKRNWVEKRFGVLDV